MKHTYKYLLVTLALMLFATASHAALRIQAGQWNLKSPSGDISVVEVRLLRKNEFYLFAPHHPISGVYTWDGKLLRITKPDNPRMGGYAWKAERDHSLTLVEETPVSISGQKLLSAHMWRLKD